MRCVSSLVADYLEQSTWVYLPAKWDAEVATTSVRKNHMVSSAQSLENNSKMPTCFVKGREYLSPRLHWKSLGQVSSLVGCSSSSSRSSMAALMSSRASSSVFP